ncbi:MAG: hypothetical protein SynsKO_05820 [Synoicihabitans sp.]
MNRYLKSIASALLFTASLVGLNAQTASLTTQTTNFDPAGGTVTFDVVFTYTGLSLSASGFEIDLPDGWSYDPSLNSDVPTISPEAVTTSKAEFAIFGRPPADSYDFTVVLSYSSGLTTDQLISGRVLYTVEGQAGTTADFQSITVAPPPTPPSFTAQPGDQTVNEGGAVTFSVTVEGNPFPEFQWKKDGDDISGATDNSLEINPVSASDAGVYTVVATNSEGSVTSDGATLTVNVGPAISTQPESQSANQGTSVTFTVVATGTEPLSYQWRKGGVNIDGATSATLQLANVQPADAADYDVVVTNSVDTVTSAAATLTVVEAPLVDTDPQDVTATEGEPVSFTVGATGTEPLGFQWMKDGQPISGPQATDSTYTIDSVLRGDAGVYSVEISNAAGSVTSASATLVVQHAPVIDEQPADKTAGAGSQVTFEVSAFGNPEITTYQWYMEPAEGGSPTQVGTNSADLVLDNVQLTDTGSKYYVDITNSIGTTTSTMATLTVNESPAFNQHPVGAVVTEGGDVTLSVEVTGNPTPTIQWQFAPRPAESTDNSPATTSPDQELSFSDLPGATDLSLTLNSINRAQSGTYRAVATNEFGTSESDGAEVDVQYAPEITVDLADQTAGVGGSVTFGEEVEGAANPEPTFEWYRDGVLIDGVTVGDYTLTDLTLEDNGAEFYFIASNGIGNPVQSRTATLTVNEQGQVTSQPQSVTVLEGDEASFTIEFSGNPTPTIQWNFNGEALPGATSATLTFSESNRAQSGEYTATVTNEFGSDTSEVAVLDVQYAPEITQDLEDITTNVGTTVTLNVEGSANPEPSFQWFRMDPIISESPGETAPITTDSGRFYPIKDGMEGDLVLESVTLEDSGSMFYVEIDNGIGEGPITSATMTLTVVEPPVFTEQPEGATLDEGASFTTSVTVTGTPTPEVQWYRNGSPISGATDLSYTISSASAASAGTYFVRATNPGNSVDSSSVTINVNTKPVVTTDPTGAELIVGQPFSTSVEAMGLAPLSYQWQKDGSDIAGATSATFSIEQVTTDDAGVYTVIVSNRLGSDTSESAALVVNLKLKAPQILVPPRKTQLSVGGSATLFVEVDANPIPTYQWLKNGVEITGATSSSLAISDATTASAGSYRVKVTNAQGSATSGPAVVTVVDSNVAPTITSQPRNRTAALESSVTFTVAATGVPAPTYQWMFNGGAISGATSASYTISSVAAANAGSYSVMVSNAAGDVTSRNAVLAVITKSFEGTYSGTFGDGSFSVFINADNTGRFIGYDNTNGLRIVGDVEVDDTGAFTFTVTSATPVSSSTASSGDNLTRRVIGGATAPSMAGAEVTISGTISESGGVTGSVEGVDGVDMSGEKQEGTETDDIAGFYEANNNETDEVTYTIIAPNGTVIVFTETAEGADVGAGTVTSEGAVSVTTVAQRTVTATVVADTATIQAEVTDSTGAKTTFSGGSSDVIAAQRLVNISSRAAAGSGEAQTIAGLVITGEDSKPVLIRAVGPGLAEFGVTGTLAAPKLDLYSGQTVIATNTGWSTSADVDGIIEAGAEAGAFALKSTDADSAILETLPPGSYTAQVSGADGGSGVVLVEVYDLSSPTLGQKLFNISTRADVGSGNETVVAGFVVSGTVPKRVLLRGVGPTLADYGVTGAISDPKITLFRGTTEIRSNDNWTENAARVTPASSATGAFALTADSKDAAMVISLSPGVYTLHMSGVDGASGVGLIEVYEIP